jgi:hypothetical protein
MKFFKAQKNAANAHAQAAFFSVYEENSGGLIGISTHLGPS